MSIMMTTERSFDSPYIETIMQGQTMSDGSSIRPTEYRWHLVFVKQEGSVRPLLVGPWATAGVASWKEEAEILWIKFKLGTFLPHLPIKNFLDTETPLSKATSQSFWLNGSAWQAPDFEHADTFVEWLAREELLVHDPVIHAVLQNQPQTLSPRSVRHRFLHATGLSQNEIRQIQRAHRAEALLHQGVSVADAVYQTGYFDQPHLTRSFKRWIGRTPGQLIGSST